MTQNKKCVKSRYFGKKCQDNKCCVLSKLQHQKCHKWFNNRGKPTKRHSEFCKMSIFQLCIPIAQTIRFGLFHTICKSCGTAHFFCLSSAFERHVSYFIPKETMNPRIINTIVSRKYVSNRFFMVLTEPASDSTDSDVFVPSLPCFFGFSPSFIKSPHSVQNAFRLPDEKQHKSSTDCFFSVFCGLSLQSYGKIIIQAEPY